MFRLFGAALLAVHAQSFEVASIKVHPEPPHIIGITTSGPRFRAEAQMVGGLIMYAYNLQNYQLSQSNSKGDDVYYDIEAKAEGDAAPTKDQFRQMVQSLLAERFQLKVHHEMRDTQVYFLVVGKNGPKLKPSAADATTSGNIGVKGRNQITTLSKSTLEELVQMLPLYAGRPVINKTGLQGVYDIKFEATPLFRLNRDPDPADISVFEAVQDQLGLKLEPQKAPIDVLVVDHVEKPTGN